MRKPPHSGSINAKTNEGTGDCCRQTRSAQDERAAKANFTIPNVELLNQDGDRIHFYTDLVQGKTVAISFFYTSCTTVCPPLTAIMSQVQRKLLSERSNDIQLISISVDPVRDTPPRLKAWSKTFAARPGWVFLTGQKTRVDDLLKSLRTFTANPQDHTPMVLIGNEPHGVWKQVNGLSSADAIVDALRSLVDESEAVDSGPKGAAHAAAESQALPARSRGAENESAHRYFGDVELLDQNGTHRRLYTDLMRGRVVLVNSFFSTCTGVCPVMARKIKDIRKAFAEHDGMDFVVLSISVDPLVDTPARLKAYASHVGAGSGWYFLTGTKENVEIALHKFGMRVDGRDNHSNLLLVGNDMTGSWKKIFSLAPTEEILPLVAAVLDDRTMSYPADVSRSANKAP